MGKVLSDKQAKEMVGFENHKTNRFWVEIDGVRYIYEDEKYVGFYRP